jgi:hypothetical protein
MGQFLLSSTFLILSMTSTGRQGLLVIISEQVPTCGKLLNDAATTWNHLQPRRDIQSGTIPYFSSFVLFYRWLLLFIGWHGARNSVIWSIYRYLYYLSGGMVQEIPLSDQLRTFFDIGINRIFPPFALFLLNVI